MISENSRDIFDIFIDTNDLKSIHPFGIEVFQKNLCLSNLLCKNLVFIGSNGNKTLIERKSRTPQIQGGRG
jgi:hypothetical protein